MKYGDVRRGSIGAMRVDRLTPQLAEELGVSSVSGAFIVAISRDAEAYTAGLRRYDVVVGFNGQRIDDPSQFLRLVADARIGSTATMTVLRNGRSLELKLPIVSSSRRRS
jgi:serine protease Do